MTTSENHLEQTLRLAFQDPSKRVDFFRALMNSTVYVLGEQGEADGKISIQNFAKKDGSIIIPFFSSLPELERGIAADEKHMTIPARTLFEMTRGNALALNPMSDAGKEFSAEEIAALLESATPMPVSSERTPAKVLLSQPTVYPSELVAVLSDYFKTRSKVKAAYLVQMYDPTHEDQSHLVIGIDTDDDMEQLSNEAAAVAAEKAGSPQQAVELMRVVPGEAGLSTYFIEETTPFYTRPKVGAFKALFGFGKH